MSRRDFQRLTAAAFGGAVIGVGMQSAASAAEPTSPLLGDPHVCRGLNTCKGKGAGKSNACAGQGACATAERHTCNGENACKGQGGCGAHPGENSCKAKGSCNVPLTAQTWPKARKRFEQLMKAAGKTYGAAPAK
ncbi:MAG TPA: hypothetical protein VHX65_19075 [Pirellulales bacterium]|nr:hypothetical protein [Pirellulales bacterium]